MDPKTISVKFQNSFGNPWIIILGFNGLMQNILLLTIQPLWSKKELLQVTLTETGKLHNEMFLQQSCLSTIYQPMKIHGGLII